MEVWGFNRTGPVAAICKRDGIACRVVPFYFDGSLPSLSLRLIEFARLLRTARPDFLLPYTLLPNVVCGLIWRLTGARACVWNQRDEGIARLNRGWERLAVQLTPQFISNSKQGARLLSGALKVRASKVSGINNGVEMLAPVLSRADWRK